MVKRIWVAYLAKPLNRQGYTGKLVLRDRSVQGMLCNVVIKAAAENTSCRAEQSLNPTSLGKGTHGSNACFKAHKPLLSVDSDSSRSHNASYYSSCIAISYQPTDLLKEELQIIRIDKWGNAYPHR